jgi:hypothetical protein
MNDDTKIWAEQRQSSIQSPPDFGELKQATQLVMICETNAFSMAMSSSKRTNVILLYSMLTIESLE